MFVVFDDAQLQHDPRHFLSSGAPQPNPEVPARAGRLLAAALEAGLERVVPADHGDGPLAAVHSPEYLQFLKHIHRRWSRIPGASAEVVPNVHPDRRDGAYPASAVGQAGYHMLDTGCPIGADTWPSARSSAQSAVHGARMVIAGESLVYALCRPPGHHAGRDFAAGFCYLNNVAIAAGVLRSQHERVAVVDIDVHHGNGTQDIFYRRADVLTVSLHADPVRFYPFFWGHASERGEGEGLGCNLNVPLPRGTGDDAYLEALERALQRVDAFAPGALVIALGLDAHEGDPFQGLALTTAGFARIGRALRALDRPALLVQEGGYLSDALGENLKSFLSGFAG